MSRSQYVTNHILFLFDFQRLRRRRSPRSPRHERRRTGARQGGRERDTQLTRSLERIHRKRRAERERMTEADLKRTYTGLDR